MRMESILRECEDRAVQTRDLKPMTGEEGIIIRITRNEEYSIIDFDPDFAVLIRTGELFPSDHVLNRIAETHNLIEEDYDSGLDPLERLAERIHEDDSFEPCNCEDYPCCGH